MRQKLSLLSFRTLQNDIKAGLPTHILKKTKIHVRTPMSSQFPNDRLSPTGVQASDIYGDCQPSGILTRFPFHPPYPHGTADTLCEYLIFHIVNNICPLDYFNIKTLRFQCKKQTKYVKNIQN